MDETKTAVSLFGRHEIVTPVSEITKENLVDVLTKALAVHSENSAQIGPYDHAGSRS